MALSQAAVVAKIRDLAATVSGITAAYSAADSDDTRLPAAVTQLDGSVALVMPGVTIAYTLTNGQHRHTYEVRVQVIEAGADEGILAQRLSVMPDRMLEVMLQNVALGGLCNSMAFRRHQGLQSFDFGGVPYTGYELIFEVSEQASATPAYGS